MIIVLTIVVIVMFIYVSKRMDKLNVKVDFILSQIQIDSTTIQIPKPLEEQILSYINTEPEPLMVQKEVIKKNAIENALSCLTKDLMLPRDIAKQILIQKYHVSIHFD